MKPRLVFWGGQLLAVSFLFSSSVFNFQFSVLNSEFSVLSFRFSAFSYSTFINSSNFIILNLLDSYCLPKIPSTNSMQKLPYQIFPLFIQTMIRNLHAYPVVPIACIPQITFFSMKICMDSVCVFSTEFIN